MTKAEHEKQRAEHEARLVNALVFVHEHPQLVLTRPKVQTIAKRYWVNWKTLEEAIKAIPEAEEQI